MPNSTEKKLPKIHTTGAYRLRKKMKFRCHICGRELPFCWNCPCGFQICDDCLRENMWGMSNGIVWICPDCGRIRSF